MNPTVSSETLFPYYEQPPREVLNHCLPVAEFEAKARTALRALGLTEAQITEKRHLFYEGRIRSPDAFSPANLEGTAELIAQDLKRDFERPQLMEWNSIAKHFDQLMNTRAFQPIWDKIMRDIQAKDEKRAWFSSRLIMEYLPLPHQSLDAIHRQAVKVLSGKPLDLWMLARLRFKLTHPSAATWIEEKLLLDQQIEKRLIGLDAPHSPGSVLYLPFYFLKHLQEAQNPTNQEEMLVIRTKILNTVFDLIRGNKKPDPLNLPINLLPAAYFEVLESMQPPLLVEEKEILYSYLEQFFYQSGCNRAFFSDMYSATQRVKSLELRTRLEKVHVARLRELMTETELSDPEIRILFVKLFEKADETAVYHVLSKDFRKIGTEQLLN